MQINKKLVLKVLLIFLSVFLLLFASRSIAWIYHFFKRVNLDEIAIVLSNGTGGTDADILWHFIRKAVIYPMLWAFGITAVWYKFRSKKFVTFGIYLLLFAYLVFKLCVSDVQLGSFAGGKTSNFYETEYVAPMDAKISWGEKRNVLFIALESIEKVYGTKSISGEVLTPEITALERRYKSFENYHSLSGLSHTIAAITGFITGLPMFYTSYRNIEKMLGTTGMGTILTDAGYQTWSIFPASGKFSLKENFMRRMGFENVLDGEKIYADLKNPPKQKPFNGVDDGVLFDYAKPIITDIIKSKKPYFIFMETINTHLEGFYTDYCRNIGFRQETMEDITKCDDKIIGDFVKWFRQADPTAVVILVNDHRQRSGPLMSQLEKIENRSLANVFVNTTVLNGVDFNRPVSAMDFFPSVLEAAGAKIQGCKLGLGVSLTKRCENVKTLRERYGDAELQRLMEQRNDLYYYLATGQKK